MDTVTSEATTNDKDASAPSQRPSNFKFKSFLASFGTWIVGLLVFFPIIWMVLNAFKTEADANGDPVFLFPQHSTNFENRLRLAEVS